MAGRGFYVNFRVPEIHQAIAQIGAYNGKARRKIENAVSQSTKAIKKGALRRIHNHSGYTKKHTVSSFNKNKIEGAIRAKSPHAHLAEFGHKGGIAKPRSKKAMVIDEFGLRRYAKSARIPAVKERPFMRPAYEDEKPHLLSELKEAVQP